MHEFIDLSVGVSLPTEGVLLAKFAGGQHPFASRGYDVLPLRSFFTTNYTPMRNYVSVADNQGKTKFGHMVPASTIS